jgi:hypothetical protein
VGEKVTAVADVAVAATVIGTAGEVLATKLVSPEYWAVTELDPVARAVVTKEAMPPEIVAVPSEVEPLKN